jgi:hypothetical protein
MSDLINGCNFSCEHEPERQGPVPEWMGLGGRGLTSTIVAAEVEPTCHPLGSNNKLVFAPGLLSGTQAANSGRLSCGAKSPLTGTIKEANSGGTSSQMLAKLGVKALIIEGKPGRQSGTACGCQRRRRDHQGRNRGGRQGQFAVVEALNQRLGGKVGVITIGQAGEMRMPPPTSRSRTRTARFVQAAAAASARSWAPSGSSSSPSNRPTRKSRSPARRIQGGQPRLCQGPDRQSDQQGPGPVRHQRPGQHHQRGRRPAHPQLHQRPVRGPRGFPAKPCTTPSSLAAANRNTTAIPAASSTVRRSMPTPRPVQDLGL